jgi:hypothetical protein
VVWCQSESERGELPFSRSLFVVHPSSIVSLRTAHFNFIINHRPFNIVDDPV